MNAGDILRKVELTGTGYILTTYDAGMNNAEERMVGYEFKNPAGEVLFEGEDYRPSPCHCSNSDDALRDLIGFLTVQPGDTDEEYFKDYTPEQIDFSKSGDCEYLAAWGYEPDDLPDDGSASFTDLKF